MSTGSTTFVAPESPLKKVLVEVLHPSEYLAALQRSIARAQSVKARFSARNEAIPVILTEPSEESL